MDRIKIHDKYFEPYLSGEVIDKEVENIAIKINNDMEGKTPVFLAFLNGAFMFASDLLKKIDIPCEISFVKFSSYQGTKSTETVKELIGLSESLKGRHVVIVEDIIDSGLTMENVTAKLRSIGVADYKIATLLFKPKAFTKSYDIDYIGFEIPNDFIVGYGLDYDEQGRNLRDIYKIVE